MRMTRIAAVAASLAITTGSAALLTQTSAQADTTSTTTTSLAVNHQTSAVGQYGAFTGYLDVSVSDGLGGGVYTGSAVLQHRLPGQAWTDVKTDSDGTDGISFGSYGSHARSNVRYRVHYLGGTDPDTATTYEPSYSGVVTVVTLWNFKDTSACPHARCHISGRLIPRTKHHKIVVQVKHGSWKRYRVVRTGATGGYRIGVTGSRAGTRYRMIITGTRSISPTVKIYRVVRVYGRSGASWRSFSPR